ncbi:MAG: hypothetical protein ACO1PI_03575 [Bacteroidota bacterium]
MENPNAYIKVNYMEPGMMAGVVFGATFAGLGAMFTLIILGAPVWLTVIVFIGIIALIIFSLLYTGEFWLYNDRLEQKLTPKLPLALKPKQAVFYWRDLESCLLDSELSRSSGERKYIKLYFINPPRTVAFNEGNDAESRERFAAFADKFIALLDTEKTSGNDQSVNTVIESAPTTENAEANNAYVKQQPVVEKPIKARARKGFYNTIWAKLLTVVFLVCTATITALYFFPETFGISSLSGRNSWRLWAIIIPGTLYMMSRTFWAKKKP